jgi:rubrerythrin
MHPKTRENLLAAMRCEAFNFAVYRLCAVQARHNGRAELAELFDDAATDEFFEEFSRNALLAGVVGADAENLRRAVEEETDEADGMYRGYAEQAAAVGDRELAERFEQLREGERRLRDAFLAALHGLGDRQGSARP